jgi:hypothetical protein
VIKKTSKKLGDGYNVKKVCSFCECMWKNLIKNSYIVMNVGTPRTAVLHLRKM